MGEVQPQPCAIAGCDPPVVTYARAPLPLIQPPFRCNAFRSLCRLYLEPTPAPAELGRHVRRGLRRDCLTPGTEIVVDGYQAKDHSLPRANGRDITFTDGTKIFLGSSGTGAPYEREMAAARRQQGRC